MKKLLLMATALLFACTADLFAQEAGSSPNNPISIATKADFLEMANDPETSPKLLNDTLKTFVSKIVFSRSDNKIVIFYYV